MDYIESLNWRYATKRMTKQKIPTEKLDRILEAVRLTPSSYGLQPFQVIVVEDFGTREKIFPQAFNQPQILECSHLLVFSAWKEISYQKVEDYIQLISKTRNVSLESLEGLKKNILQMAKNNTSTQTFQWTSQQCFIALGHALFAAALEQVDATPMGGFKPEGVDEVLNLEEKGLGSVVLCALGYRDLENDKLVKLPKVRKPKTEMFIWI
jgi:nitroreductase